MSSLFQRLVVAALTGSLSMALALTPAHDVNAATGTTPSQTRISVDLNPKPVGRTTSLSAIVSPLNSYGTVTFYDDQNGTRIELGSATLAYSPYVLDGDVATMTVPADMSAGIYHVVAVYPGDVTHAPSESLPLAFTVGPVPTSTIVAVSGPHDPSGAAAQQGDLVTVDASVQETSGLSITGTVMIAVDGVSAGSFDAPTGSVDLPTADWSLGPHQVTATYDPGSNADHSTSTSAPHNLNLGANVVDSTGVGVQYSTFYPYKDGYRDTTAIQGTRLEPASVVIRVYSSTNAVVKSGTVAMGSGSYKVVWSGRRSNGTMLPAGTYRAVQILTDADGNQRTVSTKVTLSPKRLTTLTNTITKTYSQGSTLDGMTKAWQFALPSAVSYKKLVFSVYASSLPMGYVGVHDFTRCAKSKVALACASPYGWFGRGWRWWSLTGSTTANRSGTFARVYAQLSVRSSLKSVRVVVTYVGLK